MTAKSNEKIFIDRVWFEKKAISFNFQLALRLHRFSIMKDYQIKATV